MGIMGSCDVGYCCVWSRDWWRKGAGRERGEGHRLAGTEMMGVARELLERDDGGKARNGDSV